MSDDPILSALARLEAGQADTSDRLTRLEVSQARLEAGQDDTSDRLTRLEAGQAAMHTGMTGLHSEMAAFRSGVMEELGKTRVVVTEKLAEVQGSLTAIRDDIAVNMGSVEAARLANDNTRADVRQMQEQMSVMWKQIKRLEARVRDITGDP